jgi:hypothetical protein
VDCRVSVGLYYTLARKVCVMQRKVDRRITLWKLQLRWLVRIVFQQLSYILVHMQLQEVF